MLGGGGEVEYESVLRAPTSVLHARAQAYESAPGCPPARPSSKKLCFRFLDFRFDSCRCVSLCACSSGAVPPPSMLELLERSGIKPSPKMQELYIKLLCQKQPQGVCVCVCVPFRVIG